jgi:murein DD-endopeptidase MepM/ murein hydrolase activator NlpD
MYSIYLHSLKFPFNPVPGELHALGYNGATNPINWRITQPYGCTGNKNEPRKGTCAHFHSGVDIGNRRCGDSIIAVANGKVIVDGIPPWSLGAIMVRLDHGYIDGIRYRTDYYHLKSENVKVGQIVIAGTRIGSCGSTGNSTACHLHFQVKKYKPLTKRWVNINPTPFLTIVP